jgi:hypothetical protein
MQFTANAKQRIIDLCDELQQRIGQSVIPAVMWIDKKGNPDLAESGVTIGFYNEDQRATLGAFVTIVDGFEYVSGVPSEHKNRFHGKTLDYRGGKFCLD